MCIRRDARIAVAYVRRPPEESAMSLAPPRVDAEQLRHAIRREYAEVAETPDKGFHFHTGRRLAEMLGYAPALYAHVPPENLASFAGVGRPFVFGSLRPGE